MADAAVLARMVHVEMHARRERYRPGSLVDNVVDGHTLAAKTYRVCDVMDPARARRRLRARRKNAARPSAERPAAGNAEGAPPVRAHAQPLDDELGVAPSDEGRSQTFPVHAPEQQSFALMHARPVVTQPACPQMELDDGPYGPQLVPAQHVVAAEHDAPPPMHVVGPTPPLPVPQSPAQSTGGGRRAPHVVVVGDCW